MIALSIGWGIRGNFGHEYGCMIAGVLSGIAVAVFSGREDWRARAPYFGLFAALGWAFGGAMAYMTTTGYTQGGNLPTQIYGFFAVFLTGFLWTSLGGAGTAYAAAEDRERLTEIFRPLTWLLVVWVLDSLFRKDVLIWFQHAYGADPTRAYRQRSPVYWLDSSWLEAWRAILVVCAYDLWDRRFEKVSRLVAYAGIGAVAGFIIQKLLAVLGWLEPLLRVFVQPQGDPSAINPHTGHLFDPNNMVTNWPSIFTDLGPHMGWILGLIAGGAVYFYFYGKWRSGTSLILQISVGGFIAFLVGPVLLSPFFSSVGGFRLVPPRGDNWATTLGCLLGLLRYCYRNRLAVVGRAALLSGILGGLGFMLTNFIKDMALIPGNPALTSDPTWSFWHTANWHSIVNEQGAGLMYGLAIVLTMAVVSSQLKPFPTPEPRPRRWTEAISVLFMWGLVIYLNLVKNVEEWTKLHDGFRSFPSIMRAPLFAFVNLSTLAWFNLFFLLFGICLAILLWTHLHRRLAVVPESWLGKGQLIFLVFLWMITIGNFERALPFFHEQRLGTEGTIFVNALIASFLILFYPRAAESVAWAGETFGPLLRRSAIATAVAVVVLAFVFPGIIRLTHGDSPNGWGNNKRFGPDADWRIRPTRKNVEHP